VRTPLAVALLVAWPGLGAELLKEGPWTVEVSGFYKPAVSLLLMQPSLVQGLGSLQAALAAAGSAQQLAVPAGGAVSTHTLRADGKLSWTDALELEVAWQLTGVVASDPAFVASGSSSYLGATLVTAQRRLWDLPPVLVGEGGFPLLDNLDRLAVTWRSGRATVVVGRQVISWGTGRLWNPTDLMSPFAPTDIDREVRRGADAARVSIGLGDTSQLDLLWLPQVVAADNGGVIRGRTNLWGWDFSATVAKYVRDLVLGADFSGELSVLGVHGEAAWTLPLLGLDGSGPLRVDKGFVRAVAGVEWRPLEKLLLSAEYYFNGFGATSPAGLLAVLRSDRVVRGEVFGGERHYLGLVATLLASDLVTVSATVLGNLTDPSLLLVPALEYSFQQHALLRVGGYLPLGRGVDTTVLGGLTGADALAGSAAWQRALATLGARSEYGLSPYGLFVQVGLYLN
jgi:hypothetical protein